MSHPEQLEFSRIAYRSLPGELTAGKVLEIGSYDVNGNTRIIFDKCSEYLGVDIAAGPGVDMICFGHEISLPDNTFEISISFNCFEHDVYWVNTFKNMIRLTSPGGAVIFTCASSGFPEHGTLRSDPNLSPGTQSVGMNYYKNLTTEDFHSQVNMDEFFVQYRFWYLKNSSDLCFIGQIKGEPRAVPSFDLPNNDEVLAHNSMMSVPHKIARLPMRFASRLLPEVAFQGFASRYWKYLNRLQSTALGGRFSR